MSELIALLAGTEVGRVQRHRNGGLSFVYDENWLSSDEAYPLSLSMPLSKAEHGAEKIETYLWGLLPDNEQVLDRWARKFQVSARNVFALIANVGEDCAGAVQFVPEERREAILSGEGDQIEWLDEAGIAQRLRTLREDHSAWRLPRDVGQFSLAGAQPKTALLYENGRWGIPAGRVATTHILKPPTGHFDGHAENEHICLSLAHALGLPTATTSVTHFADEVAIVVERYDRIWMENRTIRVHQEDACQALGIMPTRKYQNEGGPGIADIIELLRTYSSEPAEDIQTFIDAIGFNWLIGGSDAHAKNYSLLLSSGNRVRLAPLYDVASVLPYPAFDIHKVKLSMKIGGEYLLRAVGIRQWQKLARELRLSADTLIDRLRIMAEQLPDEAAKARAASRDQGLRNATIDRLCATLTQRAQECSNNLAS